MVFYIIQRIKCNYCPGGRKSETKVRKSQVSHTGEENRDGTGNGIQQNKISKKRGRTMIRDWTAASMGQQPSGIKNNVCMADPSVCSSG